ncbi:hypothetical protein AlacWU_05639 [Aspergillus niger]|nr:hypothetical protein AlacWU_05639 [Aspergillus niger]
MCVLAATVEIGGQPQLVWCLSIPPSPAVKHIRTRFSARDKTSVDSLPSVSSFTIPVVVQPSSQRYIFALGKSFPSGAKFRAQPNHAISSGITGMFSASPCAKAKRRALLLSVHDKEMIPMYSLVGLVLIAFPGPKDEGRGLIATACDRRSGRMPRPDLTGPSRVGPIGRDQIILRAAKALSPTTHDARAIVTRAGLELCSPLPLQPQRLTALPCNVTGSCCSLDPPGSKLSPRVRLVTASYAVKDIRVFTERRQV